MLGQPDANIFGSTCDHFIGRGRVLCQQGGFHLISVRGFFTASCLTKVWGGKYGYNDTANKIGNLKNSKEVHSTVHASCYFVTLLHCLWGTTKIAMNGKPEVHKQSLLHDSQSVQQSAKITQVIPYLLIMVTKS